MVYPRKSISKMAAAAAAAAKEHVDIALDAAVAVHAAIPNEAPARAAVAAATAGARGPVCSAIAAGVAAAAVGLEFEGTQAAAQAAFDAAIQPFDDNSDPTAVADALAKIFAEAVVSPRYPAVGAAAAAAATYVAHFLKFTVSSGGGPPEQGGGTDAPAIAAAKAAGESSGGGPPEQGGGTDAPAIAAEFTVSSGGGPPEQGGGTDAPAIAAAKAAGESSGGGPPEQGGGTDAPAIAAAKAAGATARAFKGPVGRSYVAAAAESARAATVWGANQRSVVVAAVKAATFTDGQPPTGMAQREEHAEYLQHVAATIAEASSSSDSALAISAGECGVEKLEALPYEHKRTYEGLQTIMTFGTFLAGFLLNSLSGKLDEEEQESDAEVAQIVLQTMSFGYFLAATVYAGALMLATGGKQALSKEDLMVPIRLSVSGLGLVIVTTGNWTYLALGLKSDGSSSWYILAIVIGLASIVCPLLINVLMTTLLAAGPTTRVSARLRKFRSVER